MQNTATTSEKAIAFFIGGAGDKIPYLSWGPTNIMQEVKNVVDKRLHAQVEDKKYKSIHLGFDEVYGADNIKKNVIDAIPHTTIPLYIVGTSFGGWNGAHLSHLLSNQGYQVEMLVTLDPVGKSASSSNAWMNLLSSFVPVYQGVYENEPKPKANFWINIRATPTNLNSSDFMTAAVEKWKPQQGPNINKDINTNHDRVSNMFLTPVENTLSSADYVCNSIIEKVCSEETLSLERAV